uniref:Uncharacterized protein n=1 Tax=Panagrolaimus davidi TaxID=227884 RepID=A0A914Q8S4_9BILA
MERLTHLFARGRVAATSAPSTAPTTSPSISVPTIPSASTDRTLSMSANTSHTIYCRRQCKKIRYKKLPKK